MTEDALPASYLDAIAALSGDAGALDDALLHYRGLAEAPAVVPA